MDFNYITTHAFIRTELNLEKMKLSFFDIFTDTKKSKWPFSRRGTVSRYVLLFKRFSAIIKISLP